MTDDVRQSTTPEAAGTTDQVKAQAQQAAGQAQEKVQQVTDEAKSRAAAEVDRRSTQAGEQLRSAASDARSVADELRKQGKDRPAQLAERAAERVEQAGEYLHESDGQRILRDVEDFARRRPRAVAGGGLALGFAASRLLKASSRRRYDASSAAPEAHRSRLASSAAGTIDERPSATAEPPTAPVTSGAA
jgi:hypothetical protein